MLETLSCLFAGAILLQEPAPAPRPPKTDERRPAVALDAELRRAVDLLRATRGMRFEAVVNAHAPQPRLRHPDCQRSPEPITSQRPLADPPARCSAGLPPWGL